MDSRDPPVQLPAQHRHANGLEQPDSHHINQRADQIDAKGQRHHPQEHPPHRIGRSKGQAVPQHIVPHQGMHMDDIHPQGRRREHGDPLSQRLAAKLRPCKKAQQSHGVDHNEGRDVGHKTGAPRRVPQHTVGTPFDHHLAQPGQEGGDAEHHHCLFSGELLRNLILSQISPHQVQHDQPHHAVAPVQAVGGVLQQDGKQTGQEGEHHQNRHQKLRQHPFARLLQHQIHQGNEEKHPHIRRHEPVLIAGDGEDGPEPSPFGHHFRHPDREQSSEQQGVKDDPQPQVPHPGPAELGSASHIATDEGKAVHRAQGHRLQQPPRQVLAGHPRGVGQHPAVAQNMEDGHQKHEEHPQKIHACLSFQTGPLLFSFFHAMQKGPDSRGGWPLNVTVVPFPLFGGVGRSIQLGPCGDTVIQQEEVQPFLALLVVDGGDEHAAGVNAHHLPGGQVGDGHRRLPHQLLGLIVVVDAAEDDPVGAAAVIQGELQQLLALFHRFTGLDLHHPEVGLGEGLKVHHVLEEGFDLHLGQVDLHRRCRRGSRCRGSGLGSLVVQGLHGGDVNTTRT